MDISVIIINYNTCELTLQSIKSVIKHTLGVVYEIILVDNNSTDSSVVHIKKLFPHVLVIENKVNIGFGRANNVGIAMAKGKFCFLLNSDAYLISNAILNFYQFLTKTGNENIFATGCQLVYENLEPNISAARFPCYQNFIEGSFWRHFYKKEFFKNKPDQSSYETLKPIPVDYVSGANLFIRKNIFNSAGGFRKEFFMYFEETELIFRIKKQNPKLEIYFLPNTKIVHIGQGSNFNSKKSIRFKLMYLKSRAYYFRFQNGKRAFLMVYLRGLITILFNR